MSRTTTTEVKGTTLAEGGSCCQVRHDVMRRELGPTPLKSPSMQTLALKRLPRPRAPAVVEALKAETLDKGRLVRETRSSHGYL